MAEDQHTSWSQPTQYLVAVLLLAGSLFLIYYARELLAALVIALLMSIILSPLVRLVEDQTRLNHRTVAAGVFLIFLAAAIALPVLFAPLVLRQLTTLAEDVRTLSADLQRLAAGRPLFFDFELPILEWLETIQTNTASYIVPSDLLNLFRNVSQNLAWVLVILVTVFYLLQDGRRLRDWLIEQLPEYRRDDARRLFAEIRLVWHAYLRGQVVLMVLVFVATWIGAAAVGLRGAWAVALLAGLLDIVPSLGPAIAMVVGTIVAWLTGSTYLNLSNTLFAVLVLAVFIVVQTVENVWWRPRVMGNSLKMHPAVVFIGVIGALTLSGIVLTLVIVPLIGTAGVLGRYIRARMLGIPPWPAATAERALD